LICPSGGLINPTTTFSKNGVRMSLNGRSHFVMDQQLIPAWPLRRIANFHLVIPKFCHVLLLWLHMCFGTRTAKHSPFLRQMPLRDCVGIRAAKLCGLFHLDSKMKGITAALQKIQTVAAKCSFIEVWKVRPSLA